MRAPRTPISICRRGRTSRPQIFYKPNARELLRAELAAAGYTVSPLALGTNTDPYQPVERELRVTRGILELLLELKHPVTIVTKGALILRDLDLLAELARARLVAVNVSLTTLDHDLKRRMEPRTAGPEQAPGHDRRAGGCRRADRRADGADHSGAERSRARSECSRPRPSTARRPPVTFCYGCRTRSKALFLEWLNAHYPDRAEHVQSLLRQMRGGSAKRRGVSRAASGVVGRSRRCCKRRFERARRQYGLDREVTLCTSLFAAARENREPQLDLWPPGAGRRV